MSNEDSSDPTGEEDKIEPADPETQPKTHEAVKKGRIKPPGQPELGQAPIEETYGKRSGSEPEQVPGEKSPGATPKDRS